MVNKLIRDDKVAVIYSPGFGAGWFTWNPDLQELIFDPEIAAMIVDDNLDKLETYITLKYPEAYLGGVSTLKVKWIPVGTKFRIVEYDGSESIEIKDDLDWITA